MDKLIHRVVNILLLKEVNINAEILIMLNKINDWNKTRSYTSKRHYLNICQMLVILNKI